MTRARTPEMNETFEEGVSTKAVTPAGDSPPSASLVKRQDDFSALFAEFPWIDQAETAALLAMQIATGSPEAAGQDIESQSVRNLKLINKVHTITEVALMKSSAAYAANGPGFFARISAANADGEAFTYSIGGWIPLGQLRAKYPVIVAKGWRCQVTELSSSEGNPAYRYVDA